MKIQFLRQTLVGLCHSPVNTFINPAGEGLHTAQRSSIQQVRTIALCIGYNMGHNYITDKHFGVMVFKVLLVKLR